MSIETEIYCDQIQLIILKYQINLESSQSLADFRYFKHCTESDLDKKKQVWDVRKEMVFYQQQKSILAKIKQKIDQKEITIAKYNIDKMIQLKLKNYLRIYGFDIETLKLCEQLQKNSKINYLRLFQKIRYLFGEKLKRLTQIDYTYNDNGMVVKHLRKKLMKLENEKNKDQKQILSICIELLDCIEQYEKQEYITIIEGLQIKMNEEEDIIYRIEKLYRNRDNIIKKIDKQYNEIIKVIFQVENQEAKFLLLKKLFKKLNKYQQYEKNIKIGEFIIKSLKTRFKFQIKYNKNQSNVDICIKNGQTQSINTLASKLAKIYHQVSIIYEKIGKYQQSLKYQQNSVALMKKYFNEQHPDIATSYHQISIIYSIKGQYHHALKYAQKCLLIKKKYYYDQHPNIASSYHQISLIYSDINEHQKALKSSQNSIKILKKYHGQYHPNIAAVYHQISLIYSNLKKYEQALEYSQKNIQILKKYYGQQHPDIASSYHQISLIFRDTKKYQQALYYLQN